MKRRFVVVIPGSHYNWLTKQNFCGLATSVFVARSYWHLDLHVINRQVSTFTFIAVEIVPNVHGH